MKKLIPLILVASLVLSGCNLFRTQNGEKPLTDAEMATRVAEILSTMTTPTVEMVFPATATSIRAGFHRQPRQRHRGDSGCGGHGCGHHPGSHPPPP